MKPAVPVNIYDKEGNLTKIELYDTDGGHIIDVLWDPNDAQTPEKRVEFRKWAYTMANRKGFTVNI